MSIKKISKKTKVALLGLGLDNLALLKLFTNNKAPLDITICDLRSKNNLPIIKAKNIKYKIGLDAKKNLDEFDILFRSPGWPLACPGIKDALKKGKTKISSPLNLFFSLCPTKNIIGITGTKGKGTTATLIYQILKNNFKNTNKKIFLGGNIGISPLSFLEKINKHDFVVLELSSFQLEDLNYSPKISVITNIFKEHLAPADPNNPNFHSSFKNYWQAKLNIAKQKNNKLIIINQKLKTLVKNQKLAGKKIFFSTSKLPSNLVGDYNQENIAAAETVAKTLKIKPKIYQTVIKKFSNLEHRLELVANINNIKYFDNSFSTTPESTILDLLSFSEDIIQIAGGADKKANFQKLAITIKKKVKLLLLLPGEGSVRIKNELKKINFDTTKLQEVSDMSQAVNWAKKNAESGDIVLLSTACASFGIFKNYKERGDLFKKYVKTKK